MSDMLEIVLTWARRLLVTGLVAVMAMITLTAIYISCLALGSLVGLVRSALGGQLGGH